jgi:AcrR family transcriptional regulator
MQYTERVLRPAGSQLDGRLARSVRARTAVLDALLDLIEAGDLRPTAPRIAERAGVSLRLVFHHFSDLEALFAAAAERQFARQYGALRSLPATGSLARRLGAFVRQRAGILERITPVRRAAVLMEPFSAEVAARLGAVRTRARAEVAHVFAPELAARPPAARRELAAALGAVSGWSTWHALRAHQRLSRPRATKVLTRMLTALLQEGP